MRTITRATVGALLVGAGVLSGFAASATSNADGVLTGRVFECGPGPIVASPNHPVQPIPATVTLWRRGSEEASQSITFAAKPPWSGPFTFRVAAGRYEVISTYLHQVTWVRVHAGSTSVVHFGPFACPMESAT